MTSFPSVSRVPAGENDPNRMQGESGSQVTVNPARCIQGSSPGFMQGPHPVLACWYGGQGKQRTGQHTVIDRTPLRPVANSASHRC